MPVGRAGAVISRPASPASSSLLGWDLNASNTGLAALGINGANLPTYSGPMTVPNGTTITEKKVTLDHLKLHLGNITFERCFFQPTTISSLPMLTTLDYDDNFTNMGGPVTIRDCTWDGSLCSAQDIAYSAAFSGIADIIRCRISGFGSGIAIQSWDNDNYDVLVEGNFVDGLRGYGDPGTTGSHNEAFTTREFSTAAVPSRTCTVRNNRFVADTSTNSTGSYFIQPQAGNIGHQLLQGNLLAGYNYCLQLENHTNGTYSGTGMHSINNRFDPWTGQVTAVNSGLGWATWTDNYIYAAGNANAAGAVVAKP